MGGVGQVLAAKKRPEGKPAYQVLHETADDMRRRHFEQLLAQQDARLQVKHSSFSCP